MYNRTAEKPVGKENVRPALDQHGLVGKRFNGLAQAEREAVGALLELDVTTCH